MTDDRPCFRKHFRQLRHLSAVEACVHAQLQGVRKARTPLLNLHQLRHGLLHIRSAVRDDVQPAHVDIPFRADAGQFRRYKVSCMASWRRLDRETLTLHAEVVGKPVRSHAHEGLIAGRRPHVRRDRLALGLR